MSKLPRLKRLEMRKQRVVPLYTYLSTNLQSVLKKATLDIHDTSFVYNNKRCLASGIVVVF